MIPNRNQIYKKVEEYYSLYLTPQGRIDGITDYIMRILNDAVNGPKDAEITLEIQDGTLGATDDGLQS